jgi:hypothetical protein
VIEEVGEESTIYRNVMEEGVISSERRMGWINITGPNKGKGIKVGQQPLAQ